LRFYHRSGWYTTAVDPPETCGLTYGGDCDLSNTPSWIDHARVVLCVRDIRNLLASRRQYNNTRQPIFDVNLRGVERWTQYARQALGDIDYFDGRCIPVVFDKWFASEEYRAEKIAEMEFVFDWTLEEDPRTVNEIARPAGGSSFDGTDLDGQTHKMKVLDRWKAFEDDEHVQSLLTPQVLDLNRRLIDGLR
jgi:hypothetical protein